jgi:hypothetical protein
MVAKACFIYGRMCAEAISKCTFHNRLLFLDLLAPAAVMGVGPRNLIKTKDIQAIKALMHAGELPVQDIADRFGSRATLYRNAARARPH